MVITSVDATNVPCVVLLDTLVEIRGIRKKAMEARNLCEILRSEESLL